MPNFSQGLAVFALAGLGAAAVPVIIHLLNRRRFRTLHWAPMQFLQQAMQRSRKMLEMRDVLLMLVRTAALLLFGLALARPFFPAGYGAMSALSLIGGFFGVMFVAAAAVLARPKPRWIALSTGVVLLVASGLAFYGDYMKRRDQYAQGQTTRQSVHAILLIDNSLSMAYCQGGRTLLDVAKDRAKAFVDDLPGGSSVTVIPLCGGRGGFMLECPSADEASDAIANIRIVDRSATAQQAQSLAIQAISRPPQLDKRVVLFSDQQSSNWPADAGQMWKQVPTKLQIVDLGPGANRENAWVEDLQLQDQIADKDLSAVIKVVIRYEGAPEPRKVQVALKVRGDVVHTRNVDLAPGQGTPVTFDHLFKSNVKPGEPEFVPISVSITSFDNLPQDDVRHLVVPVVEALPVLFVDQYGEHENPDVRYGETLHLRQLLAPRLSRREETPQLIKIRHMTVDRLAEQGRAALEDVRLVVMAGVADPAPAVRLLREYVEQGGQLFVAAGGDFQPAAWNHTAWEDGAGILPAPLQDDPVGKTLREGAERAGYFRLDLKSMVGEYFHLPGEPSAVEASERLRDLYGKPLFFKAVVPRLEEADKLVSAEARRISKKLQFLMESDSLRQRWEQEESLSERDKTARQRDKERRAEIQPRWLAWSRQRLDDPLNRRPDQETPLDKLAKELAERTRPRVLGRFTNDHPCLVERSVGLGSIVFFTSGTYGDWETGWNTLSLRNSVIVYDRILRSMLERTLPQRNQTVGMPLALPIDAADRRDRFGIKQPGGAREGLDVEVLEGDTYGLTLRNITERGTYSVERAASQGTDAGKKPVVQEVAFNGPAAESEIVVLNEDQLRKRMAGADFEWIGEGRKISLQGSRVRGEQLWRWLIWSVLLLFVVERIIIAWPSLTTTASQEAGRNAG